MIAQVSRPMASPLAPPALESAHWLSPERVRVYSLLIVAIVGAVAALWIVRALPSLVDAHGKPIGYDFITFWSAGRLALRGDAASAYDATAIAAVAGVLLGCAVVATVLAVAMLRLSAAPSS